MALTQCPDCKEQVSDSAPSCPKCGRPMPDAKPPKKKIGWKHYVILAVAVLAIASLLRSRIPGATTTSANATQAAADRKMDKAKEKFRDRIDKQLEAEKGGQNIAICTPGQLYREYNANEVKADGKYKGKWIQVGGVISSVAKGIGDVPYLVYPVDNYGVAHVRAELFDVQFKEKVGESDFNACSVNEKAANLKPGQTVTVECRCKGMVLSIPMLDQCIIVDDFLKK